MTMMESTQPEIAKPLPVADDVALDHSSLETNRAVRASSTPLSQSSATGWFVALMGWTILVSFTGSGGGADWLTTDAWVAQTSREMLARDDWITPWFSGEKRYQKSPGAYWAVMSAGVLGGGVIDPVAVRVPNAIAAVLMVATVFWLTRRIAGDRAAVFAGFATASSAMILYWSHRGASDLGLATLTTISLASLWIASECERPGWRRGMLWVLGYFTAGLGMLYKLPMPLVCVGIPAVGYVVLLNRWRVLKSGWHLVGLAVFLLTWGPWAAWILLKEPLAMAKWKVEYLSRFTGDLPNVQGQDAWPFWFLYVGTALAFCLPYSLSVGPAIVRAVRHDPTVNRNGMWFCLIWFFGHLAFFTLSVGKETRYFLPAMPPLMVMLGCELSALFDSRRPFSNWAKLGVRAVWVLVPVGLAGGAYGLHRWQRHDPIATWADVWPAYAVAAGVFAIFICASARYFERGLRERAFGMLVAGMWGMWLWTWITLMPTFASAASFRDVTAQMHEKLTDDELANLYYIGSPDPRVIWYGDLRIPRLIDQLDLLEMQGGNRSLKEEERLVAMEMVRRLEGDEPVLFVAPRLLYVRFLAEGPAELGRNARTMPESHLWVQTSPQYGRDQQVIVFGNKPPRWPEPTLDPPSAVLTGMVESVQWEHHRW